MPSLSSSLVLIASPPLPKCSFTGGRLLQERQCFGHCNTTSCGRLESYSKYQAWQNLTMHETVLRDTPILAGSNPCLCSGHSTRKQWGTGYYAEGSSCKNIQWPQVSMRMGTRDASFLASKFLMPFIFSAPLKRPSRSYSQPWYGHDSLLEQLPDASIDTGAAWCRQTCRKSQVWVGYKSQCIVLVSLHKGEPPLLCWYNACVVISICWLLLCLKPSLKAESKILGLRAFGVLFKCMQNLPLGILGRGWRLSKEKRVIHCEMLVAACHLLWQPHRRSLQSCQWQSHLYSAAFLCAQLPAE